MDFLRQWLLGVIACAMLVSVAGQLCPEGSVRRITRFAGGLLLLLTMLRPIAQLTSTDLGWDTPNYREAVAQLEAELGRERENTIADGIATELKAYIEDKAGSLGTDVRAEVAVEMRGGVPSVKGVTLHGAYSDALAEQIASELGIAKEKQVWIDK